MDGMFIAGTPATTVPKAFPPSGPGVADTNFQNIGYLYPMGYVGVGSDFLLPQLQLQANFTAGRVRLSPAIDDGLP